ncbi:hypothetical protein KIN20_021933 [Parelaphostrongylus tenuis]|uniref:Uncharacterized protein n=1 Tax=Parelaphostrongylus tenuis TaxID=148309 RepID=A0AAD5NB84_PARTN|nr:hypothetical protein KIN20_021933 [Parelaphostrongylus tenuis]
MDAALAAWHEKFVYDTCPLWDVDALAEKNDEMAHEELQRQEEVGQLDAVSATEFQKTMSRARRVAIAGDNYNAADNILLSPNNPFSCGR